MAGKLVKVADDAPDRVSAWPITLFHIPAPVKPVTPLMRLPEPMRHSHARWSPGWFTSGAWQGSEQSREGVKRQAKKIRSTARILLALKRWAARAKVRAAEKQLAAVDVSDSLQAPQATQIVDEQTGNDE